MATLVADKRRPWGLATVESLRIPLWQAVIVSRVLVLVSGAIGALSTSAVPGWQNFDPGRVSTSFGAVGNVLAAPVVRWDGVAYLSIAAHGYTTARSTVSFPLYPMLIRILTPGFVSPVIAAVVISLSAFAVALTLIHRLARELVGRRTADTTVLLLSFAPWSFVFSAAYTASLLLMLTAATFYLARRGRFELACLAAAGATVTHVQGILLVVPLAIIYWKDCGRSFDPRRLCTPRGLALALPPLALGGFLLYMHLRGFGWLAPITNQNMETTGRALIGPPATIFNAVKDALIGLRDELNGTVPPTGGLPLGTQNCIYLVVLLIVLLALANTWRRLPLEYAVFSLLAILLCTSSAVTMEPLKGLDRYMLPIFPLWIGAAAWISERRVMTAVMSLSCAMLMVETIQFTRWVSVF